MDILVIIIKVIILLSILKVWLFNYNKSSPWRGGEANSMKQEFANYGLPDWMLPTIGVLKVGLAIILFISIWFPSVEVLGGYGIAILMLGAIAMHVKIGDPIKKSLPAFLFLVLAVLAVVL